MKKKISFLLTLVVTLVFVATLPLFDVAAVSVGDRLDDGVLVESDASYCGCCHDHIHEGFFAKFSCFFCKISKFFKNLFGKTEDNPEHKYVVTGSKASTCASAGYESYMCLVCEKTKTVSYEKTEHDPVDIPAKDPTCTASGLTSGSKCANCNKILVKQQKINATGHSYDEGIVTTEPACEKEGAKTYTCTVCGNTKTEAVAALQHEWKTQTIANATCTVAGEVADVCQLCSAKTNIASIAATGHSYDDGVVTTEPGCETEGVKTFTCAACGDTYTEAVAATGHSYDNGVITTAPACEKEGVKTYTCTVCGNTKTEAVAALQHEWKTQTIANATCTATGEVADVCQLCSAKTNITSIAATGHSYDDGVVTTKPGCATEGVKTFTCAACGDTYTEAVAATGHSYDDGAVTTEPACETQGVKTYTCVNCSDSYAEAVAALGHSAGNVAATCYAYNASKAGVLTYSYTCERCSTLFSTDYKQYKAVIQNDNGVTFYATTEEALLASVSGDTVVVGVDDTISSDAVVPAGVTLLVPCDDVMTGYTETGYNPDSPQANGVASLYRTLTVESDASLTVNGTLLLNAVTGRTKAGSVLPYDNSGAYAQIKLFGDMTVQSGGIFDCAGFVLDEGGNVTLQSGSQMYETYAIEKWRGGTYANLCNFVKYPPVVERHMNNVKATLRIESGAALYGSVKMYADGSYHYCRYPQIENDNGLIRLESESYVLREIDTVNLRDIYNFYGDATFSRTSMTVGGISLSSNAADYYMFDGDTTFNFYEGTYSIRESFAMLPGGLVNAYSGANLVFDAFAGFAMFNQDYYTAESGLWSDSYKYTLGRPNAVMTIYEGAVVDASANKAEILGDVVIKNGAELITSASTLASKKYTVLLSTSLSRGYHTLTQNFIEE